MTRSEGDAEDARGGSGADEVRGHLLQPGIGGQFEGGGDCGFVFGVVAQNYDLSASRYRQFEQEEGVFYEQPAVTLERMRQLEQTARRGLDGLLSSRPSK